MSKRRLRHWKPLLAWGLVLLCPGLTMLWYWQKVIQPPRLTAAYSQEFRPVIALFEATEGSLDAQLNPEKILAVATEEYLEMFRRSSTPLNCPNCTQFWVTLSAEASGICVLEYTPSHSVVRATVRRTGYRVDATTYEPVQREVVHQDSSTYHLVRKDGQWKVMRISDYTPANRGQADLFGVLEEQLDELGCP